MAGPRTRLAASLTQLEALQADGRRVFQSNELTRVHRERLIFHGYLHAIMRGWLMLTHPSHTPNDPTPWYACFWEFCARYCTARFGTQWQVSPEQSLLLHAESTVVPKQVVIYAPKGTNNLIALPFGTSLYDLKHRPMPAEADLGDRDGLKLFTPEAALLKVSESFFSRAPLEAHTLLSSMPDASALLNRLIAGSHPRIAGRLMGACRRVGRPELADQLRRGMKAARYETTECDPFAPQRAIGTYHRVALPIAGRMHAAWHSFREPVAAIFPKAPGLPKNANAYLRQVDAAYQSDAYHSLSIEGYKVTPALIERVRSGRWRPERHAEDLQDRNALAARGYWQAFQATRKAIAAILRGKEPGRLARTAHQEWYMQLFQPCVAVGLLNAASLAGYRNDAVYLRGSRHVPPRWELMREAMATLFDLLEQEPEPSVRAVLGHWMLGYLHPYPDGNGRMARFLMNVMLASGGYPWIVIRVKGRDGYLAALESASIDQEIRPFAQFIARRVSHQLKKDAMI